MLAFYLRKEPKLQTGKISRCREWSLGHIFNRLVTFGWCMLLCLPSLQHNFLIVDFVTPAGQKSK